MNILYGILGNYINSIDIKNNLNDKKLENFLFIPKFIDIFNFLGLNKDILNENSKPKYVKIIWKLNETKEQKYIPYFVKNQLNDDSTNSLAEIQLGKKKSIEINLDNLYYHKRLFYLFNIENSNLNVNECCSYNYYIDILDSENFCLNHNLKEIFIKYTETSIFETIIYLENTYLKKDLVLGINLNDYKLNLISHIVPKKCSMFELQKLYLEKMFPIFNNKIIFSIIEDQDNELMLENLSFINWLKEKKIDNIQLFFRKNNKNLGEAVSFLDLLQYIESNNINEYTFYCHTKGITRKNGEDIYISVWVELMYKYCLSNIDTLIYQKKMFGGSLKSYQKFPEVVLSPEWHYTGTFYWFHHVLFNESNICKKLKIIYEKLENIYFISEMFPGLVCKSCNGIIFLQDDCCPMYECFFEQYKECITKNIKLLEYPLSKNILDKIKEI